MGERLEPRISVEFVCLNLDLGELTSNIVVKTMKLAGWRTGFREGIVLMSRDLVVELSLRQDDFDEKKCRLTVVCSVSNPNGADLCLAVASIAMRELYAALSKAEGGEQ